MVYWFKYSTTLFKNKEHINRNLNLSFYVNDFFSYDEINKAYGDIKFKVISSISCFYDLPDVFKFVEDIKKCLDKDGLWVSEQSYLLYMLKSKIQISYKSSLKCINLKSL